VVVAESLKLAHAQTSAERSGRRLVTRMLFIGHVATSDVALQGEHDAAWWRRSQELPKLFKGTGWRSPVRFALKHGLFVPDENDLQY
jgi:hypothetical protein